MYYNEDIIITRKGIRIGQNALHPIGIEDESVCWGIVLPAGPGKDEGKNPPHLVISEFHPRNWLSLFRLTIELESRIGTIAKVTKYLNEVDFNILSTQCALSGYTHATWHITGQALKKNTRAIEEKLTGLITKYFYKDVSAFDKDNDLFRIKLTNEITLEMLEYSKELEDKITANGGDYKEKNYLYNKLNEFDTLLYKEDKSKDRDNDNPDKLNEYKNRLPQSVECRWLKLLAIYRIYSQAQKDGRLKEPEKENKVRYAATWDRPIRFKYNSDTSLLEPQSLTYQHKYEQIIEKCVSEREINEDKDFPIRVTGAFNAQEHYVRINLPNREKKNKRLFIQIDYKLDIGLGTEKVEEFERSIINKISEIKKNLSRIIESLEYKKPETDVFSEEDVLSEKNEKYQFKGEELKTHWLKVNEYTGVIKQHIADKKQIIKENQIVGSAETNGEEIKIVKSEELFLQIERLQPLIEKDFKDLKNEEKVGVTSIGVLQALAGKLCADGINIDYASNSVLNYSKNQEKGKVSLIITTPQSISEKLIEKLRKELKDIDKIRENLEFETPTVNRLEARRIFVSTKFDFFYKLKPEFRPKLIKLVNQYGFIFVTGDRQFNYENSDNGNSELNLELSVTERIKSSDCFLQLFPKLPDEEVEKDKDWLLFELGVARGNGIRFEICADENNVSEYPNKILAGKTLYLFNTYEDTDQILKKIEKAVQKLALSLH